MASNDSSTTLSQSTTLTAIVSTGNLTHDGVFTYTYTSASLSAGNAAGRIVRAESITATLRYTYTSPSLSTGTVDGLRVAQDVDGAVTTFAWDWAAPTVSGGVQAGLGYTGEWQEPR